MGPAGRPPVLAVAVPPPAGLEFRRAARAARVATPSPPAPLAASAPRPSPAGARDTAWMPLTLFLRHG
jgi:hypothetical protein